MIKVGLVGEDPSDTSSIKNLLKTKYSDSVNFKPMLRNIRGHQLDNVKVTRSLAVEAKTEKCKFIIYIRDLDGLPTQQDLIIKKKSWFDNLNLITGKNNIFLLNIWELETLIFADIENFNKSYKTSLKCPGNPMHIADPKGRLKEATRKLNKKFEESHCPDIFNLLNLNTISNNCTFFKTFLTDFDKRLED